MIDTLGQVEVERVLRSVADEEVLPRFRHLSRAQISEKSPGEIVTVADRAAEAALGAALTAIVPGSVVVGEESVSTDPDVLHALAGADPVWIIDPIDGTEAYVNGNPRFTMLVALADRGRLVASWTFGPALGVLATATDGGGAFIDGVRARVRPAGPGLRDLDVVTPQPRWWTERTRTQINDLCRSGIALSFFDTAGLEYLRLAAGRRAAMLVTWEHVWDHAAGLLLNAEAGGVDAAADGRSFDLTGTNALPVVVASSREVAAEIHGALRPNGAGS